MEYTWIIGELKKLGIKPPSRNTVKKILKTAGFEPGPKRAREQATNFSSSTLHRSGSVTVRRAKAEVFSGCEPFPAGSNWSSGVGNETVEASSEKGRLGDPASMQAVTRVNNEQASKTTMRKPTRQSHGEGRRRWSVRTPRLQRFRRGKADGMYDIGKLYATREAPDDEARVLNQLPARDRLGCSG